MVGGTQLDGGLGHPEDNAALFSLGEGIGTRGLQGLHACGTVNAHAGQKDNRGVRSCQLGRGSEQNVDRGATVMDRWRLNETDFIAHAVGNQREMVVPGGDHTGSGSEFLTILRLMDREGAEFVEMLSHDPGKIGRDMLDDDDRWKSGRQAREKVAQGLDSSGGGADDEVRF